MDQSWINSFLRSREKIFNIPGVILALLVVLAAIHALRVYVLTPDEDDWVLSLFAFVPGRLTYAFDPIGVANALSRLPAGDEAEAARFFLGNGDPQPWTVLTYAFLHANWMHLGVNSLWLAAFGAPVARRFGPWRFLAFMVITAIAGAGAHYLFYRFDLMPVIGASAAISGTMAAAIRFVFVPGAPLGTRLGFGSRADDRAYQQKPLPLLRRPHRPAGGGLPRRLVRRQFPVRRRLGSARDHRGGGGLASPYRRLPRRPPAVPAVRSAARISG